MEVLRNLFSEIKPLEDFIRKMDSSDHLSDVLVSDSDTDRYNNKHKFIHRMIVKCPLFGGRKIYIPNVNSYLAGQL